MTMVTNLLFEYSAIRWRDSVVDYTCQPCPATVVLVTNEVVMNIVLENRLARYLRDIAR